ncbi:MAG TPA: hypothetical protein DIC56_21955 [Rhizobium sp.]|nr:hypothetical protein [Rhizobium sp.]
MHVWISSERTDDADLGWENLTSDTTACRPEKVSGRDAESLSLPITDELREALHTIHARPSDIPDPGRGGATEQRLPAIFGWSDSKMAQHYIKAA